MHLHGLSLLHIDSYLNVLTSIYQHCQKVVKELTGWVIYAEDEMKFHPEITVGLVRHKLININELDSHLAKAMNLPKGLNMAAVRFSVLLINQMVVIEKIIPSSKFPNVLELLSRISQVLIWNFPIVLRFSCSDVPKNYGFVVVFYTLLEHRFCRSNRSRKTLTKCLLPLSRVHSNLKGRGDLRRHRSEVCASTKII